jgi:hypothetical protein
VRLLAATLLVSMLAAPRDASAFCRSTTCKCKSEDTCNDDCGIDANGCKTKGAPLFWRGGCVGISLDARLTQNYDPDEVRAATARAFAAWSDVDCGGGKKASIALSPLADSNCHESAYNSSGKNVNLVFFEDDNFVPTGTDDVLAVTRPHYDTASGEIWDSDIEVDTSQNAFSLSRDGGPDNDLQSVLTHEVGHFLGLDHSPDASAVMYFQYSAGDLNRALQPDDIAGLCAIYPPDRKAACDPTPRGGLEDTCETTSGGCAQATTRPEPGAWACVAFAALFALAGVAKKLTTGLPTRRRSGASAPGRASRR